MKAIILSAGQGRRLLPLTEQTPKCMLDVQPGMPALQFQLRTLAKCGVDHASVIVGFRADQVEKWLSQRPVPGIETKPLYNPFFGLSDNLASAWMARGEMEDDFLLLNGDTLFDLEILRGVLASPAAPLTLVIDQKPLYDDDDMKVSLDASGHLTAVSKTLPPESIDGESIGLMLFRGRGAGAFRRALDLAMRDPAALKLWYLSVVNDLARSLEIATFCVRESWWAEIDCPEDLAGVRERLASRELSQAPADSRRVG